MYLCACEPDLVEADGNVVRVLAHQLGDGVHNRLHRVVDGGLQEYPRLVSLGDEEEVRLAAGIAWSGPGTRSGVASKVRIAQQGQRWLCTNTT